MGRRDVRLLPVRVEATAKVADIVEIGIAGAVLGLKKTESPDTGAYSYLFRASNRFY